VANADAGHPIGGLVTVAADQTYVHQPEPDVGRGGDVRPEASIMK
jgi:hypothetical protein